MSTKVDDLTLVSQRQRCSEFQLKLLDEFWAHYRQMHEWPVARIVYRDYYKLTVRKELSALGGNIVKEERDQRGKGRLHLTLLGILLTSDGVKCENLLMRYLEFQRKLFYNTPEKDQIRHTEIQEDLQLSNEDTALLGELIYFGNMYGGSGGRGNLEWTVSAMKEAEDFPKTGPLDAVLDKFTFQYYRPGAHVFEDERERRPANLEFSAKAVSWDGNLLPFTGKPVDYAERSDDGPLKRRYQVFVSSTYSDLIEERKHVIQALLVTKCIPSGMELFPAASTAQWNLIKEVIDDCDYYVVIVAGRYGSIESSGQSYTEMEFNYAASIGKPILGFYHSDIRKLPGEKLEDAEEGRRKLVAFTEKVKQRICHSWNTPEGLESAIKSAIYYAIESDPKPGWVRASNVPSWKMVDTLQARIAELEGRAEQE